MQSFTFDRNKTVWFVTEAEKEISTRTVKPIEQKTKRVAVIRFEEKKEHFVWAHPDEIIFVISADHYVKSLIKCGKQNRWMIRHCTIKELLAILSSNNFIRLNKFYLLNRNHFACINESEKTLYLDDDSSISVPHRISRYVLDLLNNSYT
jgi:DNA-binding LytR/AlgR family response regulator